MSSAVPLNVNHIWTNYSIFFSLLVDCQQIKGVSNRVLQIHDIDKFSGSPGLSLSGAVGKRAPQIQPCLEKIYLALAQGENVSFQIRLRTMAG